MGPELKEVVKIATGLVCIGILIFGVRWQARTFRGDVATSQKRMISALLIAVTCLVGAVVVCAYQFVDPRSSITLATAGTYLMGVVFFGTMFIAKTWVGPLLVSASISWAAYTFMQYGEVQLLPIFQMVVELGSHFVPQEFGVLYIIVTLAHSVLGSIYSAWRDIV